MEELSLRQCIKIMYSSRKLIAVITLISVIVSFVISYFVLEPIYEAKTILLASNLYNEDQINQQPVDGVKGFLNTMSQHPQMSLETYKEQISNPQILQQVIDELKLGDRNITINGLANMLSLSTVRDTNLISITVKNEDKKIAKDIANTIAIKFTDFVSEMSKEQAVKSSNYIKQQMDVEKENLDKILLDYKTYLSRPRGLNELQKEVDSKLDLITQYKTDLLNTGIEEQKLLAAINAAEKQLGSTSEKIKVKRTVIDEPYISDLLKDSINLDSKALTSISIEAEEVNESYIELKNTINELHVDYSKAMTEKMNLKSEIDSLQKELETLQVDLADIQHQDIIMQQKVKFAQDTYNSFLEKYEETRITKSSAIGDASIMIVSPAVEPLSPISPNKQLNIVISGLLGFMLGVFVAFFREYWITSDPKRLSA